MNAKELRKVFHETARVYEGALLTFDGVDGYDVYNCSIPFEWKGKRYLFGRVERREDFANSVTFLFEEVGKDHYAVVPGAVVSVFSFLKIRSGHTDPTVFLKLFNLGKTGFQCFKKLNHITSSLFWQSHKKSTICIQSERAHVFAFTFVKRIHASP